MTAKVPVSLNQDQDQDLSNEASAKQFVATIQSPRIKDHDHRSKTMKKAVIYTRTSSKPELDRDGQREDILARFGGEYEIVGEYHDVASGTQEIQDRPGLKAMLDAVAKGEVEVLVCSDLIRLTRHLSPEIIGTIQKAGVQIVTADGREISQADLAVNMLINRMSMTFVESHSERTKRDIRAARERRDRKANDNRRE